MYKFIQVLHFFPRPLLVLILVMLTFPLLPKAIPVDDDFKTLVIGKYLEYYEDKEGTMSIQDVSKPSFQKQFLESNVDKPNFGFTKSAYWVKFQIQSDLSEKKEILLEYSYPVEDNIRFYYLKDKKWVFKQTGDHYPFQQRDLKNRNFLFKIPLQNKVFTTYFMRIQGVTVIVPLQLYDKDEFIEAINDERLIIGIYYGIIIVMIMYNFISYFSFKDILYLYYVGNLMFLMMFQLGINGISFEYLWNNYPYLNSILPFFMFGMGIFSLLFSQSFLNTKKRIPKITNFIRGFLIVLVILAFFSLFGEYYNITIKIAIVLMFFGAPLWLFISIYIYFIGYKSARIYILSFFPANIGILTAAAKTLGFLPSNFLTENSMQIGGTLSSVIISLVVAEKIIFMRKEKEAAQNKLIVSQKQALDEQKNLITSYARFVPEQLLIFLGKDSITKVELGDSVQKDMTILFADIRSFTSISETLSPTDNFGFINSYLEVMGPIIRKYNGFIDKYIGDAIMALFPENPADAVDASIEMLEALHILNAKRKAKGYIPISIGIGIHTGSQMLGIIGEHERLEGTVISDVVNTASRLERLTKAYSTALLVSGDVLEGVEDQSKYEFRFLDTVKVKGKNKAVRIFEILNGVSPRIKTLKLATKDKFEEGIRLYYDKRFKESLKMMKSVYKKDAKDKAVLVYIERLKFLIKTGVDQNWNGIEKLDFK